MKQDPYQVLNVSPSATDDEVKAAFRRLAKQYHPDVNNSSAASEQKMKEINEAYQEIQKLRKGGGQARSGGWSPYGSGYSGYGGAYGQTGYGGYTSRQDYAGFDAVRNYIRFGRYTEAANMLNNIADHSAEWHFLYAVVYANTNNRISALDHARQAVNLDPDNPEYQDLLQHLQFNAGAYRQQQESGFGGMPRLCRNPLMGLCLMNIACSFLSFCCCGGRGGYYFIPFC